MITSLSNVLGMRYKLVKLLIVMLWGQGGWGLGEGCCWGQKSVTNTMVMMFDIGVGGWVMKKKAELKVDDDDNFLWGKLVSPLAGFRHNSNFYYQFLLTNLYSQSFQMHLADI